MKKACKLIVQFFLFIYKMGGKKFLLNLWENCGNQKGISREHFYIENILQVINLKGIKRTRMKNRAGKHHPSVLQRKRW